MTQQTALTLGISPCPNDTYIFDALAHRRIPLPFDFSIHMADVEELNIRAKNAVSGDSSSALTGQARKPLPSLDVTKLSIAAAAHVLDSYILLNSGAALGRGCGPLVISRRPLSPDEQRLAPIAIPGRLTTANALLSLTGRFQGPRKEMIFDEVMPALARGEADLGLIIHEGRFTYAERGFHLALDLGQWWEEHSGLPLPLGVIAVKRSLGMETALTVDDAIRRSIEHANARPADSLPYIRAHAQEMDETVMQRHIATFVNEFSLNLGDEGQRAIREIFTATAQGEICLPDLPFFVGSGYR